MLMREHATLLDFSDQREMFGFMLAHVARANPVAGPAAGPGPSGGRAAAGS